MEFSYSKRNFAGAYIAMKQLIVFLFSILVSPALANEIDYFCLFTNAAAAQTDPNVGAFWDGTRWDTSTAFPGISVQTSAPNINGINPNTGFWIMISRPAINAGLTSSCVMALDRDRASNNGQFVLFAVGSLNGTARTNLNFAPVPHGSRYHRPLGQ